MDISSSTERRKLMGEIRLLLEEKEKHPPDEKLLDNLIKMKREELMLGFDYKR